MKYLSSWVQLSLVLAITGCRVNVPFPTPTITVGPTATIVSSPTVVPTATPIGGSGWLAFGDAGRSIYLVSSDGATCSQFQLTTSVRLSPSELRYLDWSPSGDEIAFGLDGEIYVISADGTDQRNLTNTSDAMEFFPRWSPDGSHIAFTGYGFNQDENPADIFVVSAGGGDSKNLTNSLGYDGFASWSSDGAKIAFSSNRDGNLEVYTMKSDGSEQVNLTNSPQTDDQFENWSPDGRRMSYGSDFGNSNNEIYVMNADGSEKINLTNDPEFDFDSAWSPTGKQIAYTHDTKIYLSSTTYTPDFDIYVVNVDGSGKSKLTSDPLIDESRPTWSPDGKRIAFIAVGDNQIPRESVAMMNADGSGRLSLSMNCGIDGSLNRDRPMWLP